MCFVIVYHKYRSSAEPMIYHPVQQRKQSECNYKLIVENKAGAGLPFILNLLMW